MSRIEELRADLQKRPRTWLVTGAAGFIGSHLVETLLSLGQTVRGIDDFSTGRRSNLDDVRKRVGDEHAEHFEFVEADIREADAAQAACVGMRHVAHQAAIGSVPRSIEDPRTTHEANVDGFFNILEASRESSVESFVYASSSSVYGDSPGLPKVERSIGRPLSPYAATKRLNELYALAWAGCFPMRLAGLRYFNVVGPRQDPEGAYAAVVPRWIAALARGDAPTIFGDGETSRDFCPVENVVQANLLAATVDDVGDEAVFNVALGGQTTLLELFEILRAEMAQLGAPCSDITPRFEEFRPGDIRHSLAGIRHAEEILGYAPTTDLASGLRRACEAYVQANS
jgi:UDP-N-acetylglucosamine 4-epimerase